jgi:hypothetical protein
MRSRAEMAVVAVIRTRGSGFDRDQRRVLTHFEIGSVTWRGLYGPRFFGGSASGHAIDPHFDHRRSGNLRPRRTGCYIEFMITGALIADIAGLVGEPARATMLTALLDGRALTATELAYAARVTDVETRELFVSDLMPHFA